MGKVWEPSPAPPKPAGPSRGRSYCTLDEYAGDSSAFLRKAAEGSIWQCDICGRYWHKATRHFSDDHVRWSATWWYEVRWYHFGIRKRIAGC